MDYNMIFTLSIANLVLVFLILFLLLVAASYTDKSKDGDEKRLRGTEQELKLNQLVKSIASLQQSLKPIVDLTQKHESILSGIQSKGALGEQFVEGKLADLPHEWYDRHVPFPGGTVEFALRTPNKRWIPIDSQWTATPWLIKLEKATSQSERNLFRLDAHQAVNIRARETLKYLDKERTLGFCIVAVPDSVFNLCVDIQANLASNSIVLISYSLLVPYILLIVNQYLKTTQSTEALQISQILSRADAEIELIQKYIITDVAPPIELVSRQQTQHVRRNQGLEQVYTTLNQIQSQLNILKSMINPIANSAMTSIPPTLQRRLRHVRDGLLEVATQQNGHNANDVNE
jgi:hypothetical protein